MEIILSMSLLNEYFGRDMCGCRRVCVCLCNWQAFVVYPNDQDKMMLLNVFGGIGFGCAFVVHWCEQAFTHAHTKALTSNLSPSNAFSMCFIIMGWIYMPCEICSSLFQKWFKHDNMTPCLEINLFVRRHECKLGYCSNILNLLFAWKTTTRRNSSILFEDRAFYFLWHFN